MINDHFNINSEGICLLKSLEGCRLYPYDDTNGKPLRDWTIHATIGYGYLIPEKDWNLYKDSINKKQADALLERTILTFEEIVKLVINKPILQHQFDALVIFAYNIGCNAFKNSSAVRMINDPCAVTRYPTLELAWKAWNKQNGIVNHGLANRRNREWYLYSGGKYSED